MNKINWTDLPLSKKTKERTFVTLNLDSKSIEKFNQYSEYYGHGGKRRLMEFILDNIETIFL